MKRSVGCGVLTVAMAAGVLSVPVGAHAAGDLTLRSNDLTVTVGADFPRVIKYVDNASGQALGGQPDAISTVTIDGAARTAHLSAPPTVSDGRASYHLAFDALPGVELDASLSVSGRVTTFAIDAVRDTETSRVHTIDIPDQDLVSVASTDAGATTAFTTLDPDSTRTADKITPVTTATARRAVRDGSGVRVREHQRSGRRHRVELRLRQALRPVRRRRRPVLAPRPQDRRRQHPCRRVERSVDLPRRHLAVHRAVALGKGRGDAGREPGQRQSTGRTARSRSARS